MSQLCCNHGEYQQIRLCGVDRHKQLMLHSDAPEDVYQRRPRPPSLTLELNHHELWSRLATAHTSIGPWASTVRFHLHTTAFLPRRNYRLISARHSKVLYQRSLTRGCRLPRLSSSCSPPPPPRSPSRHSIAMSRACRWRYSYLVGMLDIDLCEGSSSSTRSWRRCSVRGFGSTYGLDCVILGLGHASSTASSSSLHNHPVH